MYENTVAFVSCRDRTDLLRLSFSLVILTAQQEKAASLKQSITENQKLLRQYKWIETTMIKNSPDLTLRIRVSDELATVRYRMGCTFQ